MATGDETQAGARPSLPPHRPGLFQDQAETVPTPEIGGASTPPPEFEPPPHRASDSFGSDFPSDFPSTRPAGPKPHILAPQANEWATNQQEIEVVKSRRTGAVLLFLFALLGVAIIALGLAALSVFRGGDDLVADPGTEAGADDTAGGTDGTVDLSTTVPLAETPDPNALDVVLTEQPFVCDGGTRPFAQISGAAADEQVTFTSPQSPNILPGTADAAGELPIRWQCDPDQAGITWELTATGVTSGKSVTFIFAGAVDAGGTVVDSEPTELMVVLTEDPFSCDGVSRVFGSLSGAEPGEQVGFSSPQASGILNGTAGDDGNLDIRWQCDADRVGTTWELTATGLTSGRTVTFSFSGV